MLWLTPPLFTELVTSPASMPLSCNRQPYPWIAVAIQRCGLEAILFLLLALDTGRASAEAPSRGSGFLPPGESPGASCTPSLSPQITPALLHSNWFHQFFCAFFSFLHFS